ncbi:MAG: enoyl-CoA hydratase/isomerase family protein [Alphaproteobacteria bacterium]|nr:enoyl-CoA hydratase/isomerase family protein [Alphaproteobacteria bacterium]MCB9698221.1 enoyl-CoA hydratase/isomerase family protein [Alphaproteobacteria bacterium]
MENLTNPAFRGTFDPADGVAVLTFQMEGRANKLNQVALEGLSGALDWAYALPGLKGIVLTSGHRDFCVGADLEMIQAERDPARIFEAVKLFHGLHRKMEKGVPVVAAINGSALGGGLELALACHHRVCLADARIQLGLPEVMLGVLPGGGGTQRLPRMIGIQAALELLTTGAQLRPDKAKAKGLVDELADTPEALLAASRAWIAANPKAKQPWDKKGFVWPGGVQPGTPDARNLFLAGCAMAYKRTAGAFPAIESIVACVQEGAGLTFDRALEVEGRRFAALVVSDVAKDMIRTLFFHKQAADKQEGLPRVEDHGIRKVTILGAGMMGAGLAFVCAKTGFEVVLKDIAADAVERGLAHVHQQIGKLKHLDDAGRKAIADRVTGTLELEPCRGSDLVIEAVVENTRVKHAVTRETEPLLAPNGIWASNTSAIPIDDLVKASAHPDRFIGLHFFSPVEKMPLLEIIAGAATSDDTLARCLAFGRAIKKTCIVVNDGYGFYTSRTFSAYIVEGAQLVAEGHDPRLVEWAAKTAGMVVPPLQVFDEVSLNLGKHAIEQGAEYKGAEILEAPGVKLVFALAAAGRLGKIANAGFYEYADGKRKGLWSGLSEYAAATPEVTGLDVIRQRLMLAQIAEVGRCLDEGILRQHRDAEVGAILGIGFAPNAGGPLAYADRYGLPALVRDLDALAESCGDRFRPAETFRRMAAAGERFFEV